jgi:hypothetical protein
MAYLARIEAAHDEPLAFRQPTSRPATLETPVRTACFSELEWSIIRLARVDALWTIRSQGSLRRLWNRFIGRGNPELANPRLEALRRISVLSWHFGFSVPGDDVADFLSAGFSAEQYEALVRSITVASRPQLRLVGGEVLA